MTGGRLKRLKKVYRERNFYDDLWRRFVKCEFKQIAKIS